MAFASTRYVGAQIGIYNPTGRKVGKVSHLSNHELIVLAGEASLVRHVLNELNGAELGGSAPRPPARS